MNRAGSVVYCVVPRDLAADLFEPLRRHFAETREIEVVVERRLEDRRVRSTRRNASARGPDADADRRRVRGESGRRIAERRALTMATASVPPLPRRARRYARRLVFLERLEPSAQELRDSDSKRLVVRFQAGDEAAFGELYLRYFNSVYAYANVALSDHHEAEDVTQQAFVRVLAALQRYEPRTGVPFRRWLFTIARNTMVDALRQRHDVLLEAGDELAALREQGAQQPPDTGEVLGWLTDREIAMFVERLPLPQRQVLVLRYMLDLPGEEIAQILGKSHTAVRKLLSRALETLATRLAAVGRSPARRGGPEPMLVRLKPLTVMARRRFVLVRTGTRRPA